MFVLKSRGLRSTLGLLLTLLVSSNVQAAEEEPATTIPPLGPLDTPRQITLNELIEKGVLRGGSDYQAVYQKASDSLGPEDDALGGIYRAIGGIFLGEGTSHPGALIVRIESRHRIGTELAPEELGPASLGYAGLTASDYSDIRWGLPELYWRQQFLTKIPVEVRVGRLVPPGFFNVTPFSDQLTSFMNLSVILSPTIPYPSGGSLGAVGYAGLTNKLYLLGSVIDANGEWDGNGDLGKGEFFKAVEFGRTDQGTGKGESYLLDNYHVSYWHRDAIESAGTESAHGISVAGSRWINDEEWGVFARVGWSSGASLLEKEAAVGLTRHIDDGGRKDYAGVALTWGRTFDSSRDQVSTELFYRYQLTKNLAITPNLQLLIDPALNPDQNKIWVAGLRVRLAPDNQ